MFRPAHVLLASTVVAILGLYVGPFALVNAALSPERNTQENAPHWLPAENVIMPGAQGAKLHGWYYTPPNALATVILLHPYQGSRSSMLGRARFLIQAGFAVLLIDLQSHGESSGDQITFGLLESSDAVAAVDYATRRAQGTPVFVIGRSLGGAAALMADPPLKVDGLILEAVFPTLKKAVANRARMRLGALGRMAQPVILWHLDHATALDMARLAPIQKAPSVTAPVLVISGQLDQRTTSEDTRELFDAFNSPKELWLVPGAAHVDLHAHQTQEFEQRVLRFLLKNLSD